MKRKIKKNWKQQIIEDYPFLQHVFKQPQDQVEPCKCKFCDLLESRRT